MKIRVIDYSTYEEWYEEQMVEGKQKNLSQLTDADFMHLYNQEDRDWEFDSIKEFVDELNTDGPYAPMPSNHIIRFFENE